ncbi:uncharacterized protein conserved in bacteria [Hahella chejuensis KCTC 2396]|uniref:Uncharacterized protein conserved in bacteria n=1 Tax=Hahella chejuensis (strain KCTC 2396) TaxID=349521 RepID=Q2SHH3_HAHCH|nr:DUF4810 domain-containing protein [Hahella chejuensis]ABC29901.1 uncharacterized protein conserved in bacteria [Hahella chejuensis KCTC 2396]
MKKTLRLIAPALALAILAGCANQPRGLYYWGSYQDVLLDMYTKPGEADNNTQIEKLTVTIEQANNHGQQVPPGLYAHLGMIYASAGEPGLAVEAFNQEKALYPESATFIDGILERAKKGAAK